MAIPRSRMASLAGGFMARGRKLVVVAILVPALGVLDGCATAGGIGNPKDPIEGFNRAVFAFNDGVDKAVFKPVAQGYVAALPYPVRLGVSNFFGNIADVFIAVNNLLQGKLPAALGDAGRVAVNSTFGLLGLFDVATDAGLEKHDEDFGQTFGRWGVPGGPYVVLPFLGPRTTRDAFAQILDSKTDPITQLDRISSRNSLMATRIIGERADFLPTDKIIDEAALDRYSYVRDAYLQRRRSKIYDGNAPREKEDDAQFDDGLKYVLLQPPRNAVSLVKRPVDPEQAVTLIAGTPAADERQ